MTERRRNPRYRLTSEVTGKVKSTMDVRLIDISEGGLLVETKLGLPPASVCEIKIAMQGAEVTLRAEVRRCRAQLTKTDAGCKVAYRSGLEFVDLDEKSTKIVRHLIASCSAAGELGGAPAVKQGAVVGQSFLTV